MNAWLHQWLEKRTPVATVSKLLKVRTEGLGVRATGRAFDLSHSTILRWEQRVAAKEADWSPSAPKDVDRRGVRGKGQEGKGCKPLNLFMEKEIDVFQDAAREKVGDRSFKPLNLLIGNMHPFNL